MKELPFELMNLPEITPSREEFEKIASAEGYCIARSDFKTGVEGHYEDVETQIAWKWWQFGRGDVYLKIRGKV